MKNLTQYDFPRILGLIILSGLFLLCLINLSDVIYAAWLTSLKHKGWLAVVVSSFTVLFITITQGE